MRNILKMGIMIINKYIYIKLQEEYSYERQKELVFRAKIGRSKCRT